MRTTLNLDHGVYLAAKAAAAERSISLTQLIENAVRLYLRPRQQDAAFQLDVLCKGGGTRVPVDFDDRDALYSAMEDSP